MITNTTRLYASIQIVFSSLLLLVIQPNTINIFFSLVFSFSSTTVQQEKYPLMFIYSSFLFLSVVVNVHRLYARNRQ